MPWDSKTREKFKMQLKVQREQGLLHLNIYKKVGQGR